MCGPGSAFGPPANDGTAFYHGADQSPEASKSSSIRALLRKPPHARVLKRDCLRANAALRRMERAALMQRLSSLVVIAALWIASDIPHSLAQGAPDKAFIDHCLADIRRCSIQFKTNMRRGYAKVASDIKGKSVKTQQQCDMSSEISRSKFLYEKYGSEASLAIYKEFEISRGPSNSYHDLDKIKSMGDILETGAEAGTNLSETILDVAGILAKNCKRYDEASEGFYKFTRDFVLAKKGLVDLALARRAEAGIEAIRQARR